MAQEQENNMKNIQEKLLKNFKRKTYQVWSMKQMEPLESDKPLYNL